MNQIVKKLNKHDYSGMCVPLGHYNWNETFSVGIFKWVLKSNGKGLKKSSVIFRVKGLCSSSGTVYEAAQEYCKKMDGGWVPSKKSVTVEKVA